MELIPKKIKIIALAISLILIVVFTLMIISGLKKAKEAGVTGVIGGGEGASQTQFPLTDQYGRRVITIINYKYIPESVTVKYGDTVVWKNLSDTRHTVTFRTISKTLEPGETWEWTITPDHFLKGTNMYWCDFHAKTHNMQGARIIVE